MSNAVLEFAALLCEAEQAECLNRRDRYDHNERVVRQRFEAQARTARHCTEAIRRHYRGDNPPQLAYVTVNRHKHMVMYASEDNWERLCRWRLEGDEVWLRWIDPAEPDKMQEGYMLP